MATETPLEALCKLANLTLVESMRQSAFFIAVVPRDSTDAGLAIQIGVALLFEKPLIVVGPAIPAKLKLAADYVIERDILSDPKAKEDLIEILLKLSRDRYGDASRTTH